MYALSSMYNLTNNKIIKNLIFSGKLYDVFINWNRNCYKVMNPYEGWGGGGLCSHIQVFRLSTFKSISCIFGTLGTHLTTSGVTELILTWQARFPFGLEIYAGRAELVPSSN